MLPVCLLSYSRHCSSYRADLVYSPLGIGASLGALFNGRFLDWNFRRHAASLNIHINPSQSTSLQNFPIEHARLQPFFPLILLTIATTAPYGFALQERVHISIPLILQFLNGFATIACTNTLNTLLVDLFPECPSTAASACNLVRCWLGALGAAIVDHMLRDMGWDWCFVFMSGMMLASTGLAWAEYGCGVEWREARRVRRVINTEREREIQALERGDGVKDPEINERGIDTGT